MGQLKRRKDLSGMVFGYITVKDYAYTKNSKAYWNCVCKCGSERLITSSSLLRGLTVSCGCYSKEIVIARSTKHGNNKNPLYSIWKDIRKRCYNKNNPAYKNYGGRGIKMSKEWYSDFMIFYNDMGDRQNDLTIDRIDCNGDYCKENCRWATRKEQANNMRKNIRYNYNGEMLTLSEISTKTGLGYNLLRDRIKLGWSIEKATTTTRKAQHSHQE